MSRSDDDTRSMRPPRARSVQSARFIDTELRPILARYERAATPEERAEALEAFLDAIVAEGTRRREDVEREAEQLRGQLQNERQAKELALETIKVLRAENARLRGWAKPEKSP